MNRPFSSTQATPFKLTINAKPVYESSSDHKPVERLGPNAKVHVLTQSGEGGATTQRGLSLDGQGLVFIRRVLHDDSIGDMERYIPITWERFDQLLDLEAEEQATSSGG